MSIDTSHFRQELEQAREGVQRIDRHHDNSAASLEEETGELVSAADRHLADAASETYERELDERLEEDAREQLRQIENALGRLESGEYGTCGSAARRSRSSGSRRYSATLCIDDARRLGR